MLVPQREVLYWLPSVTVESRKAFSDLESFAADCMQISFDGKSKTRNKLNESLPECDMLWDMQATDKRTTELDERFMP